MAHVRAARDTSLQNGEPSVSDGPSAIRPEKSSARFRNRPGKPPVSSPLDGTGDAGGSGPKGGKKASAARHSIPGSLSSDTSSLGIARYLAWVTLVLIMGFAVLLAFIFGNKARETLFAKQRSFAGIMAENLNHQIFIRFTLPTAMSYGHISLSQQFQYNNLDSTVQSLIHGMQVHSLRIFDHNGKVTYSAFNIFEPGRDDLASATVTQAAASENETPIFEIDSKIPFWEALFKPFDLDSNQSILRMEPGTFYLRTTFPMRSTIPVSQTGPLPIEDWAGAADGQTQRLGVLEFTQDITEDMIAVVQFQWTIVGITLISALVLFFLLMFFLRRAENALAARVAEEQRLLNELHQHEKLAGMGRVVAGIAHEIRNPLGIISSSAELLLRRESANPVNKKILTAIFEEAQRLSKTVRDFLDYARPRPAMEVPVDMARVIHDVLAFLEGELHEKNINVALDLPSQDGQLLVSGDKDFFYRAVYNILINSVQAMNGPGTIRIQGRFFKEEDTPMVSLLFSDNGPGFPAEERERLLDPFVTTKDDGTGLGLPIVNTIFTSQGGRLSLEDAPGGGALVRVILPAHAG